MRLEVIHVVVLVTKTTCLAQSDAVNNAGMVQCVADNGVLVVEQRFKQAAIGIETRGIQNRVLSAQVLADATFEFFVNGLRAANKANGGHAVAEVVECLVCSVNDRRVIGKTEVVVGTQVNDF